MPASLIAALFTLVSPEMVDNLDFFSFSPAAERAAGISAGIPLPAEDADLLRADAQVRALFATDLLRNLRFAEARRRLERAKGAYATAKAPLRLEGAVTAIGFMEDVHTILRHNLGGYTFTRGKLRGATVTNVTDAAIVVTPAVANTWPMFYRLYRPNLGEAMDRFVLHGDAHGNPPLAGNQHVHALVGVALMMGTLFADEPGAAAMRARYVNAAAQASPYGRRLAEGMFPDVEIRTDAVPAPAASAPRVEHR